MIDAAGAVESAVSDMLAGGFKKITLNMLGYDDYSLLYGTNKLFYDSLGDHRWTSDEYNDFPGVTPGG